MSLPVSIKLLEEHGLAARPGQKVECPFCHHKTFTVKRDDSIGKCFHPSCGRYVSQFTGQTSGCGALSKVLEQVFQDFHRALLDQASPGKRNAYGYLTEERRIHPQVVRDSMLGVIPPGYALEGLFDSAIADLESQREGAATTKKKGKQSPQKLEDPKVILQEAKEKLATCVKSSAGWLAFFYTDPVNQVVSIRFREPYSKRILYFKPQRIGGVFNHCLFSPGKPGLSDEHLLVVEGEFNQLQVQSLCARWAELCGAPPEHGYIFSCAVGGVNNADLHAIRRLSTNPVVCYDHDLSKAGFALVEAVRKVCPVRAFTTPKPESDLDEFIRDFREDTGGAHEGVKQLIASATVFHRPYETVKDDVDAVRRSEGGKGGRKRFEVYRNACELIVADVQQRGVLYQDSRNGYVFLPEEKALMAIRRDSQDLEIFVKRYGIVPSEELFKHVIDHLRLEALSKGAATRIFTFVHYRSESNTIYLFDFDQHIYRITGDKLEKVDNGTDGVLFLRNSAWEPFSIEVRETNGSPLKEVILDAMRISPEGISPDDRRLLFLIWLYSLFFPELFPTRPILAFIGEKGSGKSIAIRKAGQLLFGPKFNVMQLTDDPKDFDAAVTNEAFVAVDNSDTRIKWLEDRLAVVATGGTLKRREYFTTNKLVEYPVQAYLAITSRSPHFRRDDIADRLLLFYVTRFEKFQPETKILAEVRHRRNDILSELIGQLQEVLKALQSQAQLSYPSPFRMADFADFALKIAHGLGYGEKMASILDRLAGEQSSFALEDDQVFEFLHEWLSESAGANVGREVTTADLCRELGEIAEKRAVEFPYKGKPRAFAQRLRNLMSNLRQYFEINERTGRARKRFLAFRVKASSSESAGEKDIPNEN